MPAGLIGYGVLPSEAAAPPAARGTYQVAVTNGGKCLDVPAASKDNGALLQQWSCTANSTWQQFRLAAVDANDQLVNVNSGKCVDVPGWSTTSGVQLQQDSCVSSQANQLWRLVASGTNTFQVISVHSGLCVSIGASTASGAAVIQETCTANTNKQWAFNPVGGRAFRAAAGSCRPPPSSAVIPILLSLLRTMRELPRQPGHVDSRAAAVAR